MDDVRAKFAAQALAAAASTSGEFRAIIAAEVRQWARVIKDANIPVQLVSRPCGEDGNPQVLDAQPRARASARTEVTNRIASSRE